MNTTTVTSNPYGSGKLWRVAIVGHPALAGCAVVLLALLPVFGVAFLIDERTVLGTSVWVKPAKFAIALALYTITLSWYVNYLPATWRQSRWFNRYVDVVVLTIVLEMLWLIGASSIGEASHFNQTHPILAPVYFFMGVLATILTSLSLLIGIGILNAGGSTVHVSNQHPTSHQTIAPANNLIVRYAMAFGLILTFLLTIPTAGYLSSAPAQTHAVLPVGVSVAADSATLPILGWLRGAGDLRVAHFFATHALHAVPIIALALTLLVPSLRAVSRASARGISLTISVAYSMLVGLVFLQALSGRAFL